MVNKSKRSLYRKIRNKCLRYQIKSLNEQNMTSHEQVLANAVNFSLLWHKILHNTVGLYLKEGKDFSTGLLLQIKELSREVLNIYNDFNIVLHFIKLGLMEKLVNKDYVKFDNFFYSRYGNMVKVMDKIRYDAQSLLVVLRIQFV